MADTPFECRFEVGDSTSGVADLGGGSHLKERGPEGMLQLSEYHTSEPPWESLHQGAGNKAPADSPISDSGGTMQISSWPWNNGPTVFGRGGFMRVLPSSLHVFCGFGEGAVGCTAEISGPRLQAIRSLCNQSESCVRILSTKSNMFPVGAGLCQSCPLSLILFVIFTDRISRHSRGEECVWFGNLRTASLLLADDVVLLVSSACDLQQELGRFAVKCELVRMRVSTSKSKAMALCQKTVDCPLSLGDELLPQARECKYLRSSQVTGSRSGRWTDGLVRRKQ